MAAPVKDPATGKFVSPNPAADKAAEDKAKAKIVEVPALEELSRRFIGNEKPDDKKKEEKEKKVEDEVLPKKPAAKPPVKPNPTAEALERTTKALETIVDRLPGKPEPKKEEKTPDPLADLDPTERRKVNVLRQMEKDFPDNPKYKGLADRYLNGQKQLSEYAEKWQAEHDGQEFDAEAEEHQAFYAQHDVDWNDDDYIESITNIKANSLIEARQAETNKKLSKLELAEKRREEEPNIVREGIGAARTFWKQFGDDFAEVLSETGVVNNEAMTELAKADPDRYNVAVQAAQKVETLTGGMYKLLNGLEEFSTDNKVHAYLADFAVLKEQQLLKTPAEDQKDSEGRTFVTRNQFRSMSEEDRKKHWTFSARDFGLLLASEEAARAKKFLDDEEKEFRRKAAARGIKIDDAEPPEPKKGTEHQALPGNEDELEEEALRRSDNDKPRGPASTPMPKVAALAKKSVTQASNPVEAFLMKQLGKS